MKFLDIIKIAAITSSEYKKIQNLKSNNENIKTRNITDYSDIKSNVRTVTYNLIGERVLQKVKNLPIILPLNSTFFTVFQKLPLNSRLENYRTPKQEEEPYQFLKEIPKCMKFCLKESNWILENKYKLDFRRTIRICRTIIEMRWSYHPNENLIHDCSEVNNRVFLNFNNRNNYKNDHNNNEKNRNDDYDYSMDDNSIFNTKKNENNDNNYGNNNQNNDQNNSKNDNNQKDLFYNDDIPELILLYFTRNYGSTQLNVSHQRIFHFLDALIKYSNDHPIINIFHSFLFYEDTDSKILKSNRKITKSLLINSWGYLYKRGYVTSGDLVPRDSRMDLVPRDSRMDLGSSDSRNIDPGLSDSKNNLNFQNNSENNLQRDPGPRDSRGEIIPPDTLSVPRQQLIPR